MCVCLECTCIGYITVSEQVCVCTIQQRTNGPLFVGNVRLFEGARKEGALMSKHRLVPRPSNLFNYFLYICLLCLNQAYILKNKFSKQSLTVFVLGSGDGGCQRANFLFRLWRRPSKQNKKKFMLSLNNYTCYFY